MWFISYLHKFVTYLLFCRLNQLLSCLFLLTYIQVPPFVQDKAIIVTVLLQLLYNVFVFPRVINITVFVPITLFLLHTRKTNMLCNQLALP